MTTFIEREIPLGWNALVNNERKTVLIIGEYKNKGKLLSVLELVTKPTKAELDAYVTALGYEVVIPKPASNKPANG